ncbi:MAG: cation transporter [Clostridia bacterium]|nr:cation transporter [Clostridia bacterium]
MTALLLKLFVKEKPEHPEYRAKCGNFSGVVGIFCNLLLFALKLTVGILSSSISVMADALNNLSDMGSSIVTILGFRLASKPADPDHPYGHGRFEYISAFVVSGLILVVGVELFKSSVDKILNPTELHFTWVSVGILVASVIIKFWMYLFNRKVGKSIDSDALIATAADSRNDALTTTAILISVVIMMLTNINVDAYIGLLVSLFILWSGLKTAKETLDPLLGQPLDTESAKEIEREIMAFDGFLGVHDLMTHNYGVGRSFASVHVEVPCNADIVKTHEQIDLCEKVVFERTGVHLTIHMDPVETDNEKLNFAKGIIAEKIREIHPGLTIHDFRMTPKSDERTNLIFDVVIPADLTIDKNELKEKIQQIAKAIDPTYCCVIEFDINFVK